MSFCWTTLVLGFLFSVIIHFNFIFPVLEAIAWRVWTNVWRWISLFVPLLLILRWNYRQIDAKLFLLLLPSLQLSRYCQYSFILFLAWRAISCLVSTAVTNDLFFSLALSWSRYCCDDTLFSISFNQSQLRCLFFRRSLATGYGSRIPFLYLSVNFLGATNFLNLCPEIFCRSLNIVLSVFLVLFFQWSFLCFALTFVFCIGVISCWGGELHVHVCA